MAAEHEGWYLKANVDISGLLQANKATTALFQNIKKVDAGLSGLHGNDALAKSIKSADLETASYIDRLKSEGKVYEANKAKVGLYSTQVDRLKSRQHGLVSELDKIAEKSGKASDAYHIQKTRINETAASINHLNSEINKLRPTGFDRLTAKINHAEQASSKLKGTLRSGWDNIKGGAYSAAAGIGALGAAAVSGAKKAGDLQQKYKEINNLAVLGGEKQGEVTKSISKMQSEGRTMSIKYGKSQQEIAEGYEDLVKRGYKTKQALGALRTEVQASVASGDKFSDVTTVSSQVLDAFGMRAKNTKDMLKNTRQVVNELAYSADATSTGFSDLGVAMSYVGTAAKANNISLAETSSALGVLSNNGLESDKAGTALRATINGLTNQINKIGTKNSIFTKLGIKKSEMLDAHGNLKGLSHDMGVLYQHIESHSKGGSDKNGFFKSIFGTSGMNGAMILAKSSKEVEDLTKRTEKAGKTGSYVAKLAAQNMGTAQGSAASAKQAMNAFKMTLGNALLPAINQASNALAKFLLSKDGKKFQKDVGGAVAKVANGLVKLIKWTATHKREVKWIGYGILAGYSISKGLKFISFLGQVKKGLEAIKAIKFVGGLFGKVTGGEKAAGTITKLGGALPKGRGGAGILTGALQSAKSAGGFEKLSTAGKLANGAAGVGVALDAGSQFVNAYKDRHNADKRSRDIGQGIGSAIGGGIGMYFGGPLGAMVGSQLGKVAGKWGGTAVNNFTKGWQKHKPPKNFWSLENLGWSTKDMFGKMAKGWNSFWGGMGNWRKKQSAGFSKWTHQMSSGIGKWASNVGKGWNKGVKGVGKWFHDIPSNLDRAGNGIKKWAGSIGPTIHKGWNRAITASHHFFKSLPKNTANFVKSTKRNMGNFGRSVQRGFTDAYKKARGKVVAFGKWYGKTWSNIWKSVNSNRYIKAFKRGQFFQVAFKDMRSRWNSFSKWFRRGWNGFWNRANKTAQADWNGTKRNWNNFWGAMSKRWNEFKKDFGRAWGNFWKGVGNTFKGIVKGIADIWNNTIGGIVKGWQSMQKNLGAFGKWAKNSWTGTKNNVKAFGNDINYALGGSGKAFKYTKINSHANGGAMHSTHGALVGEAGPELAYTPYANHARLLGANGPQFTKVHAGEKILNAKDTRKVMSGGLGRGLILKGYASGNTKLNQTTKTVSKDYKSITSNATKQLTKLDRTSKSKWRGIASNSTKQSSKTRKSVVSDYTKMHRSVDKQMDNMHRGVVKTATATSKGFGKAMDKMTGYAKNTMSDTIGQLNKGIRGIDKVIGEFGGNASAIKPVHFATGSNGELPNNTLAMVNDAKTGPRQESIVRGNNLIIPSGKDRILPLQKGDKVLNGHQTQEMAHSMGLPHFAKGSGVGHGELKNLYNIAKRNWQNPEKTGKAMFGPVTGLRAGAKVLADAANKTGSDQGIKYWSTLWSLAHKKVDDDSGSGPASGLLKAAEKYGEGHKYVWGAAGPTTFDCSGLVQYTLKHAYGISYPHYSGSQYGMTEHISKARARMGDLVFWGSGGSDHVGIYAGGNKYFSAESPAQGIHMNTLSSVVGKGAPMFGRVKGANMQGSNGKKVTVKANNSLDRFVKNSAGSGFWATMQKIGDEFGEGGQYGNPSGDGVARWRKYIRRAANQMHASVSGSDMAKILSMISAESGGNPTITQQISDINSAKGTPAQGLLQFVPSTFDAFAAKGHRKLKNGYDQLLALFNDSNWKSDIHYGGGWGPTGHRRFAKGGTHHGSGAFLVGEKGPEIMHVPGDVSIDDYQTSKRKIKDFARDIKPVKANVPGSSQRPPINININFNGSVGNSKADEERVAQIVQVKLVEVLERYFGHEFGSDPSIL